MARSSTACRCSWGTRVHVASKGQSIGPVGLDKHPYRTPPLVTSRRRRVVLAAHSCRARHTCGRLLHPRVGRPRLQGLLAGAVCRRRVWTQRSGYAPPVLVDLYAPRRRADRPPLAMAEVTFGGKWRRSGSYKMSFAIALRAAKATLLVGSGTGSRRGGAIAPPIVAVGGFICVARVGRIVAVFRRDPKS